MLRIDVGRDGYTLQHVEVPHRPFDEVFHEAVSDPIVDSTQSAFVRGLAELQARRTASGSRIDTVSGTESGSISASGR